MSSDSSTRRSDVITNDPWLKNWHSTLYTRSTNKIYREDPQIKNWHSTMYMYTPCTNKIHRSDPPTVRFKQG